MGLVEVLEPELVNPQIDNRIQLSVGEMLRGCPKHQAPAGLEHPRSSLILSAPRLRHFFKLFEVSRIDVEQCQFNYRWLDQGHSPSLCAHGGCGYAPCDPTSDMQ